MEAQETRMLRMRQAAETLALLARQHHPPTREEIVRVHELHARHERECGRVERARAAEQRAARARDRIR
jgi:hypothetical protein